MLTRSFVLATALTVGVVVCVGSSAFAVAIVPGDASGAIQNVQSIAAPSQDPAEGMVSFVVEGTPEIVGLPAPTAIDGGDQADPPAAEPVPSALPTTDTVDVADEDSNGDSDASGSGESGSGDSSSGNSGHGSSGKSDDDKAKKDKEDKAKKDKEDKAKKDKEDKAKKDKDEESDD